MSTIDPIEEENRAVSDFADFLSNANEGDDLFEAARFYDERHSSSEPLTPRLYNFRQAIPLLKNPEALNEKNRGSVENTINLIPRLKEIAQTFSVAKNRLTPGEEWEHYKDAHKALETFIERFQAYAEAFERRARDTLSRKTPTQSPTPSASLRPFPPLWASHGHSEGQQMVAVQELAKFITSDIGRSIYQATMLHDNASEQKLAPMWEHLINALPALAGKPPPKPEKVSHVTAIQPVLDYLNEISKQFSFFQPNTDGDKQIIDRANKNLLSFIQEFTELAPALEARIQTMLETPHPPITFPPDPAVSPAEAATRPAPAHEPTEEEQTEEVRLATDFFNQHHETIIKAAFALDRLNYSTDPTAYNTQWLGLKRAIDFLSNTPIEKENDHRLLTKMRDFYHQMQELQQTYNSMAIQYGKMQGHEEYVLLFSQTAQTLQQFIEEFRIHAPTMEARIEKTLADSPFRPDAPRRDAPCQPGDHRRWSHREPNKPKTGVKPLAPEERETLQTFIKQYPYDRELVDALLRLQMKLELTGQGNAKKLHIQDLDKAASLFSALQLVATQLEEPTEMSINDRAKPYGELERGRGNLKLTLDAVRQFSSDGAGVNQEIQMMAADILENWNPSLKATQKKYVPMQ